jgi:NitT/TauT family transport system ATP-binding protein
MAQTRMRCHNLSVAYGRGAESIDALRNVSLELREGEFVSLVGPSGCGKTTLLRALAGFVPPRTGVIDRPGADSRGSIGLVLQDHSLFPWMTAIENAAFALEMQNIPREEREEAARRMLQRFGLAGRERSYPHQLSSGMRQRVAVARAFLSRASLLLMDEPFGALDAITRQCLQQELLREWSANRPAVLFVTHDVEEAIFLGSRVLVMSSGHTGMTEFEVPFDHPRPLALALSSRFVTMKREIYSLLGLTAQEQMAVRS